MLEMNGNIKSHKEQFVEPVAEVITFQTTDVITSSGEGNGIMSISEDGGSI